MAEVLSQSEIESLLSAMTTVEDGQSPGGGMEERLSIAGIGVSAEARPAEGKVFRPLHKRRRAQYEEANRRGQYVDPPMYEPYDFRRPDKLSKENLRSLQMMHETFANYCTSSLSAYLRAQAYVQLVSVEQVPYDEYMRSISASLLNIVNLAPLPGQGIFELDFGILFSMLDRLLGGTGAAGKIVRDLTDIEKRLAANLVNLALADLQNAWSHITNVTFEVASIETSPQFVQIVPGNDTVALILFEVRMGDFQGAMSLCLPYLVIKPILGRLSAQRWLTNSKRPSAQYSEQLGERLRTTRVACVARLGTAALCVSDIATLEVGQIIPMQVPTDPNASVSDGQIGTVEIVVGGQPKFRGRTGLRGRKLAVQIEQAIAPPIELTAHRELN